MYYPAAELLFPHHLIKELRELRGPEWARLVDRVTAADEVHPDSLAFLLMMIELGNCLPCNSQSYKFLQGCMVCSARTVRCFKGTDQDLIHLFEESRGRIQQELPVLSGLFAAVHPYTEARAQIALE